jgi:DnaJ-class molecular chaperone
MRRDYYAVLGIAATAAPREIRQAYRRLARQYSPDINFWDDGARSLFTEISEAYRVLSDPRARSLYDRFGAAGGDPAVGSGRRGDELHVAVELSLADAVRGITLGVEVNRYSLCLACRGPGCANCSGRGVRRQSERVSVSIPAGVDTGTVVRVPGEGHAGPHGGPRGDLIVNARVRDHPFFTRKGDNLQCEIPISFGEAVLGTRLRIPAVTGEATVVVPPGTQSGETLRLGGQGVPHVFDEGVGDLLVTVRVEIPRGLDARTQGMVRELDRLLASDLRAGLARWAECRG